MTDIAVIGPWQLLIALVFICIAGGASILHRLGLERDLLVGTVRTFAQLFIMGYVLKLIFGLNWAILVIGVYLAMIVFAARIIKGRVKEPDVNYLVPTFLTMLAGYFLVTLLVTGVVVQASPWWKAQYFLPLGGMIVGNSMNALALSLERLFSDLRARRDEVEMRLGLGADYREASQEIMRNALKAGMIPSINSMMGVGVVFIPGMMTGQILAGVDPMMAVRYQIVVMLMLVGSTAVSSLAVLTICRKRCFSPGQSLILFTKRTGTRPLIKRGNNI